MFYTVLFSNNVQQENCCHKSKKNFKKMEIVPSFDILHFMNSGITIKYFTFFHHKKPIKNAELSRLAGR